MGRVKATKILTTHIIAQCRNCDWRNEDYLRADSEAWNHASEMDHNVILERAQSWQINPKDEDKEI